MDYYPSRGFLDLLETKLYLLVFLVSIFVSFTILRLISKFYPIDFTVELGISLIAALVVWILIFCVPKLKQLRRPIVNKAKIDALGGFGLIGIKSYDISWNVTNSSIKIHSSLPHPPSQVLYENIVAVYQSELYFWLIYRENTTPKENHFSCMPLRAFNEKENRTFINHLSNHNITIKKLIIR